MICRNCADAADFAEGRLVLPLNADHSEVERLRRGHARCRMSQLLAGQGSLNDGTAVNIGGHHCDCQHVTNPSQE